MNCKECGKPLYRDNKSGFCAVHYRTPGDPRSCKKCGAQLRSENASGLCGFHYLAEEKRRNRKKRAAELRAMKRRPKMAAVIRHVSDVFGVPADDIIGKKRRKEFVRARQVVCYLGKLLTGFSYPQIGRTLEGRDHSTVIHNERMCIEMMRRDRVFRSMVRQVRKRLKRQCKPAPAFKIGLNIKREVPKEDFGPIIAKCEAFFARKRAEREARRIEAMNDDELTSHLAQQYAQRPLEERLAS